MELARIFASTRTRVREQRFDSGVTGMALPATDGYIIGIDPRANRADRSFTFRHELAHILADEVEHALFLSSEDTMGFSERRADLFAVVDLTPTRWMEWIRRPGMRWRTTTLEVMQAYRELTEGWSERRLWDRARLRVMLYRQHGI